jgi:precorrin-6B methylase 2
MHVAASLCFAAALFAPFAGVVGAQDKPVPQAAPVAEYEPQSGQEGKDVVWVPTPQVVVDKMLEIARVGPKDVVIDLGSGDGRLVITAAGLGARALGIEYNPDMVELSRRNAEKAGVSKQARFVKADLFEISFAEATVVTMFLLPDLNLKLRPKILALKPGTRIVSNTFTMADWAPDATADLAGQPGCTITYCKVLYWVVPRRVAGTHKVAQGELKLRQTFQMLTGTLRSGGASVKLTGRVRGEAIELAAGGKRYRGRFNGRNLELRDAA